MKLSRNSYLESFLKIEPQQSDNSSDQAVEAS